jgi:metallo-beta-lactamase family protein
MAKKKTERSDITITYLGNNSIEVTGSCILIETPDQNILLECGMVQSTGNSLDDFKINAQPFPFKPKNIDIVFLNHSHIDHSGLICKLIHDGFAGHIVTTPITAKLLKPMFKDSLNIIKGDAKSLSKQRKKDVQPFFNSDDIDETLDHIYEYDYNNVYQLSDNISFQFLKNSHIIGAAQLELYIKNKMGVQKTILYTSDLGQFKVQNHYVEENDKCTKASVVISECTYGGKNKESAPNRDKDLEKLGTIIQETCIEKHGRILIPVFSLSRSQEILTNLYEMYHNIPNFKIPIIVDSPLILEINKIYKQVLDGQDLELFNNVCNWKNVHFIKSVEESKSCIVDKSPKIVLSSSGFIHKGRSLQYLSNFINNINDTIVSVGYSPETSIFGRIKNGEPIIKIEKKNYEVKCSSITLNSFSSHISRHELLSYMKSIYCDKYIFVHANEKDKLEFKETLEEELSKMCRTSIVQCSTKNMITRL